MTRYLVIAVLLVLISYLGYDTVFGKNGYLQSARTEKNLEIVQARKKKLEKENQSLKDEISELSLGNQVTEALAREDLGLIKSNEQFFRVIDKEPSSKRKEK
ncbi:MAG: septum formation initiator family protein [Succinivibrio sp.]|uniref:Cell division protein FtsB n=1 Tax=Succinivibrio faecicola TaxID=2820300 RepID=A0ABS7DGU4_9GAMM|nr:MULTISPECIES: septum formation initiator family protein [Succinivibrio]MBW7570522.1 septum formation initiator family protein [Succinivibrio faecicola]MCI6938661.1 septum formation initiator family protein [Succinatimonas hippei]MDD6206633.1 septum formation initiator family protein [Succinivibrio sp.]